MTEAKDRRDVHPGEAGDSPWEASGDAEEVTARGTGSLRQRAGARVTSRTLSVVAVGKPPARALCA